MGVQCLKQHSHRLYDKIAITKTCLYNFDPLKPHFYIVKLGFTGVYIIFHISAQNIDCEYSLEPPRQYQSFLSKNFRFLEVKFSIYLNRRVFVMRHFRYRFSLNRIYTKYSRNENTPIQIYRKFHLQKLKIFR